MLFDIAYYESVGLGAVRAKVLAGERLDREDGRALFACPDPHAVAALAHHVRIRMHGDAAFYVLNRHVNYTNVCVNGCLFCAFRREEGQNGAFTLTPEDVLARLDAPEAAGATEIHIVGGCHPKLRLDFFIDLLARVHAARPDIVIKAFTAVEIEHFAQLEGIDTVGVLAALKEAGLSMMPGGGAEIFAPEVRQRICPKKISGARWLEIAGQAHALGIRTNCTMLYGHWESTDDRLDHLEQLRAQQDATGGFVCFIPLPFLTENNELDMEGRAPRTGMDDLRTMAVSRLMLDNIPHIKAYWVMHSVKLAQAMLHHGADDFDGTVVEEKIGHMAGADSDQAMSVAELEHAISDAGFRPVRRDSFFTPIAHKEADHA